MGAPGDRPRPSPPLRYAAGFLGRGDRLEAGERLPTRRLPPARTCPDRARLQRGGRDRAGPDRVARGAGAHRGRRPVLNPRCRRRFDRRHPGAPRGARLAGAQGPPHTNRGHGQSCLVGYIEAGKMGGNHVFQIDSDGQCDPAGFAKRLGEAGNAPAIYGRRITSRTTAGPAG
jgi:hypothetical protein